MRFIFSIILLFYFEFILAQDGFQFESNINKVVIPVKIVNNLIIIPIEINNVSMNFLLDTGVKETVLFSLEETAEINFSSVEKILIRGFGKKDPFEGYKTSFNRVRVKDIIDNNHSIYLVLDQDINISSQVGIPVNGIIGYHFFKNHPIKIDFDAQKITVYKKLSDKKRNRIVKQFEKVPLIIDRGKPFVTVFTTFLENEQEVPTKLLLDTGNSDALWYFLDKSQKIKIPVKHLNDYLGKTITGEIYGERGRIKSLKWSKYLLDEPIASFPDTLEINKVNTFEDRNGSIGSEILKRFTLLFDYQNEQLYLKKNTFFNEPFQLNMSGIEVQHQGLEWVQTSYEDSPAIANNLLDVNGDRIAGNLKYKFELKPVFVVASVRKNSPAEAAGLQKDDIIIKINSNRIYNYSLQNIIELLKSEEGRTIKMQVDRNGKIIDVEFQLKSLL